MMGGKGESAYRNRSRIDPVLKGDESKEDEGQTTESEVVGPDHDEETSDNKEVRLM